MSDFRLYRMMRDLEGRHCGNEYLGNIVTCEECRYSKKTPSPITTLWCKRFGLNDMAVEADDFCSWGELAFKSLHCLNYEKRSNE